MSTIGLALPRGSSMSIDKSTGTCSRCGACIREVYWDVHDCTAKIAPLALRAIAEGTWNDGRDDYVTAVRYAREVLEGKRAP